MARVGLGRCWVICEPIPASTVERMQQAALPAACPSFLAAAQCQRAVFRILA
jgi:hypothetical protein